MSRRTAKQKDPRILAALDELKGLIQEHFPSATFKVLWGLGDMPEGVFLEATVDIEDPDEVMDLVIHRMVELEVDEGLPVYVLAVRPLERIARDPASRA